MTVVTRGSPKLLPASATGKGHPSAEQNPPSSSSPSRGWQPPQEVRGSGSLPGQICFPGKASLTAAKLWGGLGGGDEAAPWKAPILMVLGTPGAARQGPSLARGSSVREPRKGPEAWRRSGSSAMLHPKRGHTFSKKRAHIPGGVPSRPLRPAPTVLGGRAAGRRGHPWGLRPAPVTPRSCPRSRVRS